MIGKTKTIGAIQMSNLWAAGAVICLVLGFVLEVLRMVSSSETIEQIRNVVVGMAFVLALVAAT